MSSDDGIDSSTQGTVVRCVWAPMSTSYRTRYLMSPLPEDLAPVALTQY
jgi:hypothetical protein